MNYHNLIIKFFTREISADEINILKSWLDINSENRLTFNEENELWQEASIKSELGQYRTDSAWKKLSTNLGFGKNNPKAVTILRKNNFRILLAAAIITSIVTIVGLTIWIADKPSPDQKQVASTRVVTKEGEKANIYLSDSTLIILNSGSTLQYNNFYNFKDRSVILAGEAFFDVRTDHDKPFVVQLDQMSISATGTRFNVYSFIEEDRIETTLEEGVIQVLIKDEEPINVNTGQQVIYFIRSKKVLVRNVATDVYTSWKENKLRFIDTPFEEVLRQIGRWYNVNFEIKDRDLLNLKYTGTFIDESIEDVMQMLKTVSPITYKIQNRTSVNDKQYFKPKIIVDKRKT